MNHARSRDVRASLDHPVIDVDGHVLEYLPAALPYIRESLGPDLFDRYVSEGSPLGAIVGGASWEDRLQGRIPQSAWWGTPAGNTRDLATAALPKLLHERLDEFGIDFSVLFPTKAMGMPGIADGDMRAGVCHGYNEFLAHTYGPYRDRIAVAGLIPMHTPDEAVAEIEHCKQLGFTTVGLPEGVLRQIPDPELGRQSPWLMPNQTHWFDMFGLDSAYDYDPVWRSLVDNGFVANVHGGLGNMVPHTFTSISSYVYNHIGFFGERMARMCKSLFLGGVTRRHPDLNVAFLECGVGWASTLLADIVEHWEKRNLDALRANLDPATVDWHEFDALVREYGDGLFPSEATSDAIRTIPTFGVPPEQLDEFVHVGIESKEDIRDLFVEPFYFGCEADDRTVAFAFSPANAFGARLKPVFSSDIAHWDVEDMSSVVAEAHGLVAKGLIDDRDFRDFTFTNAHEMFTQANPAFFEGTAVADASRRERGVVDATIPSNP